MNNFSIHDERNSFGTATAAGELPNQLYVGKGSGNKTYWTRRDSQGGQLGVPFFAEFFVQPADGVMPTGDVALTIEGAPDTATTTDTPSPAAAAWKLVGNLTIPKEAFDDIAPFRVGFSNSKYKWFRAKFTGAGVSSVSAYLHKAELS